eukprot:gene15537-21629_t
MVTPPSPSDSPRQEHTSSAMMPVAFGSEIQDEFDPLLQLADFLEPSQAAEGGLPTQVVRGLPTQAASAGNQRHNSPPDNASAQVPATSGRAPPPRESRLDPPSWLLEQLMTIPDDLARPLPRPCLPLEATTSNTAAVETLGELQFNLSTTLGATAGLPPLENELSRVLIRTLFATGIGSTPKYRSSVLPLVALDLSGHAVGDSSVKELCDRALVLSHRCRLQTLRLAREPQWDHVAAQLVSPHPSIPGIPSGTMWQLSLCRPVQRYLVELDLSNNPGITWWEPQWTCLLRACRHLRRLDVSNTGLLDADFPELSSLLLRCPFAQDLEALSIGPPTPSQRAPPPCPPGTALGGPVGDQEEDRNISWTSMLSLESDVSQMRGLRQVEVLGTSQSQGEKLAEVRGGTIFTATTLPYGGGLGLAAVSSRANRQAFGAHYTMATRPAPLPAKRQSIFGSRGQFDRGGQGGAGAGNANMVADAHTRDVRAGAPFGAEGAKAVRPSNPRQGEGGDPRRAKPKHTHQSTLVNQLLGSSADAVVAPIQPGDAAHIAQIDRLLGHKQHRQRDMGGDDGPIWIDDQEDAFMPDVDTNRGANPRPRPAPSNVRKGEQKVQGGGERKRKTDAGERKPLKTKQRQSTIRHGRENEGVDIERGSAEAMADSEEYQTDGFFQSDGKASSTIPSPTPSPRLSFLHSHRHGLESKGVDIERGSAEAMIVRDKHGPENEGIDLERGSPGAMIDNDEDQTDDSFVNDEVEWSSGVRDDVEFVTDGINLIADFNDGRHTENKESPKMRKKKKKKRSRHPTQLFNSASGSSDRDSKPRRSRSVSVLDDVSPSQGRLHAHRPAGGASGGGAAAVLATALWWCSELAKGCPVAHALVLRDRLATGSRGGPFSLKKEPVAVGGFAKAGEEGVRRLKARQRGVRGPEEGRTSQAEAKTVWDTGSLGRGPTWYGPRRGGARVYKGDEEGLITSQGKREGPATKQTLAARAQYGSRQNATTKNRYGNNDANSNSDSSSSSSSSGEDDSSSENSQGPNTLSQVNDVVENRSPHQGNSPVIADRQSGLGNKRQWPTGSHGQQQPGGQVLGQTAKGNQRWPPAQGQPTRQSEANPAVPTAHPCPGCSQQCVTPRRGDCHPRRTVPDAPYGETRPPMLGPKMGLHLPDAGGWAQAGAGAGADGGGPR